MAQNHLDSDDTAVVRFSGDGDDHLHLHLGRD